MWTYLEFGDYIILLCGVVASVCAGAVVHELGHLIFGWFCGYRFSSISLFGCVLVRTPKGLVLRKNAGKVLCQCIMAPHDTVQSSPMIITGGGMAANFIAAVICFMGVLIQDGTFMSIMLRYIFSVFNIFFIIANISPTASDGETLRELWNAKHTAEAYDRIMAFTSNLNDGKTFGDGPVTDISKVPHSGLEYEAAIYSYYGKNKCELQPRLNDLKILEQSSFCRSADIELERNILIVGHFITLDSSDASKVASYCSDACCGLYERFNVRRDRESLISTVVEMAAYKENRLNARWQLFKALLLVLTDKENTCYATSVLALNSMEYAFGGEWLQAEEDLKSLVGLSASAINYYG